MNNNVEKNDNITESETTETIEILDNTDTLTPVASETIDKNAEKKKRKRGKIVFNIITTILFIIIILEAAIGIINMQRISNKEEPIWYISTKTTEYKLKTVTEYHLGLYKIVKTDTSKETKITLKPFFLAE